MTESELIEKGIAVERQRQIVAAHEMCKTPSGFEERAKAMAAMDLARSKLSWLSSDYEAAKTAFEIEWIRPKTA